MSNKNNKFSNCFLAIALCFSFFTCFAQRGKDGIKIISTSSAVVNEYTTLTANAAAGSNVIDVANSSLNTNGYFAAPLAAGDLIFIIQIQGATITVPDDSTYGTITAYNNAGNNEFGEVVNVSANTITIACALKNNYTAAGRVQVVRVPRYSTLTINTGASLTCPAWDGYTGGIVVVEVLGSTTIYGRMDVSAKGFRGGAFHNDVNQLFGVLNFIEYNGSWGGEKGEGIAGYQTDYDAIGGRYCRGAAANGGGGGNGHDGAAGGGANAGDIYAWNGYGVPDISNPNWITAWNLEWAGFANNNSSGGGRGGYDFSSKRNSPLIYGPGDPVWQGDNRKNNGGMGGHPLDYSTGALFFGGGGGAGSGNNNVGGAGGAGGGMIYFLSYDSVKGNGNIVANGQDGFYALSGGQDGEGAAGAGGTIIINATGTIASTLTLDADGGKGGDQIIYNFFTFRDEADGVGGGGGGGYIAITNGTPVRTANGGPNGTTDSGSMTAFTPNGATKGGAGFAYEKISSTPVATPLASFTAGNVCLGDLVSFTNTSSGGNTFTWYFGDGTSSSVANPPPHNYTVANSYTISLVVSNGNCKDSTSRQVAVSPVPNVDFTADNTTVCDSSVVNFTNKTTGATSYLWTFGDGASSTAIQPSHLYNTPGVYTITLSAISGGCLSSKTAVNLITVAATPRATVTITNVVIDSSSYIACTNDCLNFFASTSGSPTTFNWTFSGSNTPTSTDPNPTHICYTAPGVYYVGLKLSNGTCNNDKAFTDSITIKNCANPVSEFGTSKTRICDSSCITFDNLSINGITYKWIFAGGNPSTSSDKYPAPVCYLTPGDYDVALIVYNYTKSDSTNLNGYIHVFVNPSAPSITQKGDTLISSPAYAYQWYHAGVIITGETNMQYIASVNGDYSVVITDANGCTAEKSGYFIVTGIKEKGTINSISIFPNPISDKLNIVISNSGIKQIHLKLRDALGQLLIEKIIFPASSPYSFILDTQSLAQGIYLLSLESASQRMVVKLVK